MNNSRKALTINHGKNSYKDIAIIYYIAVLHYVYKNNLRQFSHILLTCLQNLITAADTQSTKITFRN